MKGFLRVAGGALTDEEGGDEGVRRPSILYRVSKDGTFEILKVVRGLGLRLDENAVCAFEAMEVSSRNGVPVDVALNVQVNFSLR